MFKIHMFNSLMTSFVILKIRRDSVIGTQIELVIQIVSSIHLNHTPSYLQLSIPMAVSP
jgi:hypothetical protein